MSERAALLRHIIDHPDDDTARLVMADWFDEHGEPERAEFVRLQVSLAQEDVADDQSFRELTRTGLRREYTDSDRRQRFERMNALHDRHRAAWVADLAQWARREVDFRRGFVSHLHTPAKRWLAGAAGLHRKAPLTELALFNTEGLLPQVFAKPELARIAELTLLPRAINTEASSALVRSPHCRGLRALHHFGSGEADHDGVPDDILGADWPALEAMLLGSPLSDDHLSRLVGNATFANLRHLSCNADRLLLTGVLALADAPHLGRLTHLSLSGLSSNSGAIALVRSARLGALRNLAFRRGYIRGETVIDLAGHPSFARLRRLDLTWNPVGDAGAVALANSPYSVGLRTLELQGCQIGDEGALALARSSFLSGLRSLSLEGNTFRPTAAGALRERFGERVRVSRG